MSPPLPCIVELHSLSDGKEGEYRLVTQSARLELPEVERGVLSDEDGKTVLDPGSYSMFSTKLDTFQSALCFKLEFEMFLSFCSGLYIS